MGQGGSNGKEGGSVFVLLSILVLIVGIVAAAGMVMAVLNYTRESDTPINITVEGSRSENGERNGYEESPESGSDYDGGYGGPTYSKMGSSVNDMHYDSRVWSFQVSGYDYRRVSYIDRKSRQFKGYLFDVINEVCQIAGKNCQLIHDSWSNCWNNAMPAQGILGRWYDACTLWGTSLDRLRSLKFSKPLSPTPKPVFLTLPGNPQNFDPENVAGKKIGFLSGWWSDRFCLLFSSDQDLDDGQISTYDTATELLAALENRLVDAVFVSNELPFVLDGSYDVAEELDACLQGGDAMMMRKESLLRDWWDPAFEKLLHSRTYRGICSDIEDPAVHGDIPGRSADELCIDY